MEQRQHEAESKITQFVAPSTPFVLLAIYPYLNRLFQVNLENAGYTVRRADTIEEARLILDHTRPHVLVCHFDSAGLRPDVSALLSYVRLIPELKELKVLLVGEGAWGNDAKAIQTVGADACLVLPFPPQELVTYVRGVLPEPETNV